MQSEKFEFNMHADWFQYETKFKLPKAFRSMVIIFFIFYIIVLSAFIGHTYIILAFVQLTWNYAAKMCRQLSIVENNKSIKCVGSSDEIFGSSNSKWLDSPYCLTWQANKKPKTSAVYYLLMWYTVDGMHIYKTVDMEANILQILWR